MNEIIKSTPEQSERENAELRCRVAALAAGKERRSSPLHSIGVIITDPAGRVSSMNQGAEALTGWNEAGALGQSLATVFQIINEETHAAVESPVELVLHEGQIVGFANHTLLVAKDGTRRPIADSGVPIRDAEGQVIGVVLVFRDQTEERAAQRTLLEDEARFRAFFDEAPISKSMTAPDEKLQRVNPAFRNLLGYSAEELASISLAEITHPDDLAESRECMRSLLAGDRDSWAMDKRYFTKDGSLVWIHENTRLRRDAQGQPLIFLADLEDITDRKKAEEALSDSEKRYRRLFESAKDGILILDADTGQVVDVNPFLMGLLGYSCADFLGKIVWDLGSFKDIVGSKASFRELQAKDYIHYDGLQLKTRDGRRIDVEFVSNAYPVDHTSVIQCNIRDITERMKAERFRQKSQQRAQTLLALFQRPPASEQEIVAFALDQLVRLTDSTLGFIGIVDPFENTMTAHVWPEEAMQECATDNKPVQLDLRSDGLWADTIRQQRAIIINDHAGPNPLNMGCPADHVQLTRFLGIPLIRDGRAVLIAGLGNKVEEYIESDQVEAALFLEGVWEIIGRKRAEQSSEKLEEQLRMAQKIEAIGSLAGGIAHDFNNLLAVILSYTGFALEDLHEGDPLRDDLQVVKKAGESAVALTRQLLAFSRKQVLQPEPLDLNQIMAGLDKMLRRILGEDIDLVQRFTPELGLTMADPGQIEQVIMNLVVNARDAMPEGGKLMIEFANVELDEEYAASHVAVKPGPYVRCTVSDTGCGMEEQTRARIFEPFFTTKEKGRGTGLGLSTVYGIVKQSGGNIWIYSEPDKGTTFKIYLPRMLETTAATPSAMAVVTPAVGTETVLVVEDEEDVRNVVRRILGLAGYTVLTAANGGEALLTCEQHQGEIHLVLTDVVMPKMGGRALVERLAQVRPKIKVLYMSGYTDNAIIHHGVLDPGTRFIGKPFSTVDLTRKVREVLDEDRSETSADPVDAGRAV